MSEAALGPRRVSRVLILDPLDRVLLLRFRLRDGREVWIPPGGGVDPGESASDAGLREVREETGVVVSGPLHLVWLRTAHYFQRDVIESYFFARVPATPPVTLEAVPGGQPISSGTAGGRTLRSSVTPRKSSSRPVASRPASSRCSWVSCRSNRLCSPTDDRSTR